MYQKNVIKNAGKYKKMFNLNFAENLYQTILSSEKFSSTYMWSFVFIMWKLCVIKSEHVFFFALTFPVYVCAAEWHFYEPCSLFLWCYWNFSMGNCQQLIITFIMANKFVIVCFMIFRGAVAGGMFKFYDDVKMMLSGF